MLLCDKGGDEVATTKTRINFYATQRIENLIRYYTEELGMNQGAFISMCISEYAKNDKLMENMAMIQTTIQDLGNLKSNVEK